MTVRRRLAVVPDRPLRVVPYLRVSALMGRGGEDFHSPEVQLRAIRRSAPGMREVAVIRDIDETGTTFDRAGIDKIRSLAQSKAFDVLAVYKVSRIGRNTLESLMFLNELADFGITIISAKEHIDTSTPAGRKQLTDLLSLAQMQSEEIGEMWADTIRQRAVTGQQHGPAPFGYRKVDKKLVVDPVTGPIMTECFGRYAQSVPLADIARYYHAATGRPVDPSNLKAKLRNPVYRGLVHLHGEILPGAHKALVKPETWQRCETRLALDHATPPRHVNPTWALAGLVFCTCGRRLQLIQMKNRAGVPEARLLCAGPRTLDTGSCKPGVGRPLLARVERAVLDHVTAYVAELRSDHVAHAAALSRRANARADVATLERELAKSKKAQLKLATAWATDEDADDEIYRAAMAELKAASARVAQEFKRAKEEVSAPEPEVVVGAAEALLSMWEEMTPAEQGRALRAVMRRVVVRAPARWREPEDKRVGVPEWV